MTLNFPNTPTNGQVFQGYQYSTPKGVWQAFPQVNPGQYGAVPGSIMLWFSDVIPTAALAMEGQTITGGVALFPALAAIYPAWVSGANLVLPDTRGRVLVGRDTGQAEFDVLGEAGGAKTHTLSTAESPAHTHAFSATTSSDAHTHTLSGSTDSSELTLGFSTGSGLAGSSRALAGNDASGRYSAVRNGSSHSHTFSGTTSSDAHTHTVSGTSASTGGGGAHNNLQPYIVARYIVWAASIVGQYDPIVQQALVASVTTMQSSITAIQSRQIVAIVPGAKFTLNGGLETNKLVVRNGVVTLKFQVTSTAAVGAFDNIATFPIEFQNGLTNMVFTAYNTGSGGFLNNVRLTSNVIQFVGSLGSGTNISGSTTWVLE